MKALLFQYGTMNRRALALCALLAAAATARGEDKTVAVWTTARNTPMRLTSTGTLTFSDFSQPKEDEPFVLVDPDKKFQTMIGIGAALTDAAADVFAALPSAKKKVVVEKFFDPERGIGYSFARTNMNSCDFSSMSYTYVAEGDKELRTFDVAHDRQNKIPLIKAAIAAAGGKLTMFASPWSPPAWMKDNNDVIHGGKLKPEYYQSWANYYTKFIRAYEREGVPVWGITIQNEPMASQTWESCIYTADEEKNFLKKYLGPAMAKAGLGDRKILIWDHNRDLMHQRASVIFDDPEASKFAYGLAYHWYEGDNAQPLNDNVRRVAESYPDKPLIFSEGTIEDFDAARLDDWSLGERYGREMIRDFNNGTAAWTDWNLMLDERGGPNHVGNYCMAALHVDSKTHTLRYTNIYEYMGHFSKFVRPGARRVAASSSKDGLLATAFLNMDGSLAVIVMNAGDQPIGYSVWIHGRGAPTTALPRSISTLIIR
ncbi:MAG: glycoside hydrolase family 30 beta sandwich domain-containing protein [Elusimicrobiota bacterium]